MSIMPGEWDMLKDDETLMLDEPDNFDKIPTTIDTTFDRDGRKWRVSVVAGTFVIGTAVDAQLDTNGEPVRSSDVIKVAL